jgi:hypothetical protein
MDDLKGLAEVADRLVYESLALVVPGAVLILAVLTALGGNATGGAITSAGEHPWLAAAASWAVGLVLQGASRPITDVAHFLFTLPARAITAILPPKSKAPADPSFADLRTIARDYWQRRLGIATGFTLRPNDVRDLSFSVITTAQARLNRFRALASGTRALAAIAALVAVYAIIGPLITLHSVSLGWFGVSAVAIASYFALMERSRMYNDLWDDIITPQFLATVMGGESNPSNVD